MKSEQHIIDVKKVIESSTQVKTLRELEKEGRRAVKVVRASRITELIEQAVDNVIAERSMKVVEEEKNALIQSTGDEFRRLLRDADEERKKGEVHREKVVAYEKEILDLKHKLELSEHIHAEDTRLLEEHRRVVDDLREKVNALKTELEEILRRQQSEDSDREKLRQGFENEREKTRNLRAELARAEALRKGLEERAREPHSQGPEEWYKEQKSPNLPNHRH